MSHINLTSSVFFSFAGIKISWSYKYFFYEACSAETYLLWDFFLAKRIKLGLLKVIETNCMKKVSYLFEVEFYKKAILRPLRLQQDKIFWDRGFLLEETGVVVQRFLQIFKEICNLQPWIAFTQSKLLLKSTEKLKKVFVCRNSKTYTPDFLDK